MSHEFDEQHIYAYIFVVYFSILSITMQFFFELFYYPLDTWKTRLQYKSIYGMDNANGIRHIYRGFCITMLLSVPLILLFVHITIGSTLYFHVFTKHDTPNIFTVMSLICLVLLITCLLLVPREVVKVRQQLNKTALNTVNILREAYRKDGLMNGVFRGYWITFVVMTIDFFQNTISMRIITFAALEQQSDIIELIGFSFVLAILPPLDLAKTAIQIHDTIATDIETSDTVNYQQLSRFSCITEENKKNPFKILLCIYEKRGFRDLYAGIIPIAVRMIAVTIIAKLIIFIMFGVW